MALSSPSHHHHNHNHQRHNVTIVGRLHGHTFGTPYPQPPRMPELIETSATDSVTSPSPSLAKDTTTIDANISAPNDTSTNTIPEAHLTYFTPNEVAHHNLASDCWISLFGHVYDLTPLVAQYRESPLSLPLIEHSGQDLSHWFDSVTRDPKTRVDPVSGLTVFAAPHGRFVHVPPPVPTTDWDTSHAIEWWHDHSRIIGRLSSKPRLVTIANTLTGQSDTLEVASEDAVCRIRARYMAINRHAESYVFKRMGTVLDLDLTLSENGIADDSDEMVSLGLNPLDYVPVIHIYFKDDLTVDSDEYQ